MLELCDVSYRESAGVVYNVLRSFYITNLLRGCSLGRYRAKPGALAASAPNRKGRGQRLRYRSWRLEGRENAARVCTNEHSFEPALYFSHSFSLQHFVRTVGRSEGFKEDFSFIRYGAVCSWLL
jgi:hypothetical protein